jgi:hypothetical protein
MRVTLRLARKLTGWGVVNAVLPSVYQQTATICFSQLIGYSNFSTENMIFVNIYCLTISVQRLIQLETYAYP